MGKQLEQAMRASQQASFLYGFCFSSCLQIPAMYSSVMEYALRVAINFPLQGVVLLVVVFYHSNKNTKRLDVAASYSLCGGVLYDPTILHGEFNELAWTKFMNQIFSCFRKKETLENSAQDLDTRNSTMIHLKFSGLLFQVLVSK